MRETKTLKEIFFELYPPTYIINNDYGAFEAIGYLKGIKSFAPSWGSDADEIIKVIVDCITTMVETKQKELLERLEALQNEKE